MIAIHPSPLLKTALIADALACAALALAQIAAPGLLQDWLGIPRALLLGSGVFLLGYTVLLLILCASKAVWKALVAGIVLGNIGWALACIGLALAAPFAPGPWGLAYLLVQAAAVLGLAGAEYAGLNASRRNTTRGDAPAALARGR